MDFAISANYRGEIKESGKVDKYADLDRELKKNVEHEGDNDTNFSRCTWNGPLKLGKGMGIIKT